MGSPPSLPALIDVTALHELQRRGDVVVADVRWYISGGTGREAYDGGHVPGAVFVDLDRVLAGPPSPQAGRHPLPEPAAFAAALSALGIGDDDLVVAYDDIGGVVAARLVWLLRVTGRQAALLDGGIRAWDGQLDLTPRVRAPAVLSTVPWPPERLATIDDVADRSSIVLDARQVERYRGENETVDPRPGHVPGALSFPCRENLTPDGHFLPMQVLRQRLLDLGVTERSDVISYCGSGVTACHNLLTLELAGFGPGRLYSGSWSQYGHTDRPVATGPEPG